jgi:hypothetical protein
LAFNYAMSASLEIGSLDFIQKCLVTLHNTERQYSV